MAEKKSNRKPPPPRPVGAGRDPRLEAEGKYCEDTNKKGEPCNGFKIGDSNFCPLHDEENVKRLARLRVEKKKLRNDNERELLEPHDLSTHRGLVQLGAKVIRGILTGAVKRIDANTIGYLLGIQMQAIRAANEEQRPSDSMEILLKGTGQVQINMTSAERKAFLQAGKVEKQLEIIEQVKADGRVIDLQQTDQGKYEATVQAKPRRERDCKIAKHEIAEAFQDEGIDITPREVTELFGSHLGDTTAGEAAEAIGFDHVFEKDGLPSGAYHDCELTQQPHPVMPGVKIGKLVCKTCGDEIPFSKKMTPCPKA